MEHIGGVSQAGRACDQASSGEPETDPRVAAVLHLQRAAGNQAVAKLLARKQRVPSPNQVLSDPVVPNELATQYQALFPAADAVRWSSDYSRIQALLRDKAWMIRLLKDLDRDLRARGMKPGKWVPKALTNALTDMERKHGFGTARLLPIGLVPGNLWLELIRRGFAQPKDPGAGLSHGEFTHRIQWWAIMRDYERNRGLYRHTPLELYKKLGDPAITATVRTSSGPMARSLFGYLMDVGGRSMDAHNAGEGFRRPDDVMWMFIEDDTVRHELPVLSYAVKHRYKKRATVTPGAAAAYSQKKRSSGQYHQVAHPTLLAGALIDAADMAALVAAATPPPAVAPPPVVPPALAIDADEDLDDGDT